MTPSRWVLATALAASTSSYAYRYAERSAQLQSADAPVVLYEGATFEKLAGQGDHHVFEASLAAGDFVEMRYRRIRVLPLLPARSRLLRASSAAVIYRHSP